MSLRVPPQLGLKCPISSWHPQRGPGTGALVKHRFSLLCQLHAEPCGGLAYTKECLDIHYSAAQTACLSFLLSHLTHKNGSYKAGGDSEKITHTPKYVENTQSLLLKDSLLEFIVSYSQNPSQFTSRTHSHVALGLHLTPHFSSCVLVSAEVHFVVSEQ